MIDVMCKQSPKIDVYDTSGGGDILIGFIIHNPENNTYEFRIVSDFAIQKVKFQFMAFKSFNFMLLKIDKLFKDTCGNLYLDYSRASGMPIPKNNRFSFTESEIEAVPLNKLLKE